MKYREIFMYVILKKKLNLFPFIDVSFKEASSHDVFLIKSFLTKLLFIEHHNCLH